MTESYAITLLRHLQEEATAASVPWTEYAPEGGFIYFEMEDVMEVQASDLGSFEIMIESQATRDFSSIYVIYQSEARPDNVSEVRELFNLLLSGKLFELTEKRHPSIPGRLIVQRGNGRYYDMETKRDVDILDTLTVTPILRRG